MSDAITLNYYNSNAAVFSETTKNVDFFGSTANIHKASLSGCFYFWILVVDPDVIRGIF